MQIPFSFHRIHPTTWSITRESVTMATFQLSARRLILAGGFAVAVAAAPAIAVFAVPTPDAAPMAQCPGGEEADQFTGVCVPHTVPNAGAQFSSIPGNPSIPAVNLPAAAGPSPAAGTTRGSASALPRRQRPRARRRCRESTVGSQPDGDRPHRLVSAGRRPGPSAGSPRVVVMPAKSDPAELGDVEPLADSTARQARRVVAAYATDADECRVFLSMLGIGPSKIEA